MANVFPIENRGKQHIAICAVACVMASMYPVDNWTRHLIDTCVIEGDNYFTQQIANIQQQEYELSPNDFNGQFKYMTTINCTIHIKYSVCGRSGPMGTAATPLNLSKALQLFFESKNMHGILQCYKKFVAFGKTKLPEDGKWKYFVYDCQSYGKPLFVQNQGCAYMIKCRTFPMLVKCLQWTLRIRDRNQFSVFNVIVKHQNSVTFITEQ